MRSRGIDGAETWLERGNATWVRDRPLWAGFPLSCGRSLSFSGFSLKGNSLGTWVNPRMW